MTKSVCTICGVDCRQPAGLASHMKSQHPDKWVPKGKQAQERLKGVVATKRKYVKRKPASVKQNRAAMQHTTLGWCPVCGMNLNALAAALSTTLKHL